MCWHRQLTGETLLDQAEYDQSSIQESMKTVTLDTGHQVRILDQGAGEPIIFIPMMTELNFVYAPQIEEFSTDHRVILYEPHLSWESHVGIRDRAREVITIMNGLGMTSAHIVAWSDAGAAAYHLAKTWPERCRSVVFLGLADRYRFSQPLQFFTRILSILPVERLVPPSILARILARYLGGPQIEPSWVARRAVEMPHLPRLFKHSILPNLHEHRPRAGEVKTTCLLIFGDCDALVSLQQATRMARLLPKAGNLVVIPGGEHFLGYVNSDQVNRIMREFYSSPDLQIA